MGGVWGQEQDSNTMAVSVLKKLPGEMRRVAINYEEPLMPICNIFSLGTKDSLNPLSL